VSRDEWNALIERASNVDMVALARRHGVELRKEKHEFVGPCPVCGCGNDRFAIRPSKGLFNCRICARGGKGAIDLEMFCAGVAYVEAVKRLTGTTSLSDQRSPAAEAAAKDEASDAERRQLARWLWSQRRPVKGTIVETYLRNRGYSEGIPPTIGFLPARRDYAPAMISAYALPNEVEPGVLGPPLNIEAVHITELLPDGSDRVRRKDAKRTIAPPLGRPIAVSSLNDGLSLVITEGVEDALAYAAAGYAAWACGSASYFPALEISIPDYLTTIIMEQHQDENGAAQKQTARLAELLRERRARRGERPVEIIMRKAAT